MSWPQCPPGMGIPERRTLGRPMPLSEAEFVILGLTNGPGFTANPCLADQVAWVRERHLLASAYAVVSLPDAAAVARHRTDGPYDGATRLGALANAGYQQALANVVTMRKAGLTTPVVCRRRAGPRLRVERRPGDQRGRRRGCGPGLPLRGLPRRDPLDPSPVGGGVVGDLALGLPGVAGGRADLPRRGAGRRCGDDWSIQGGTAVLGQWVETERDQDLTCPGTSAQLGRWFQQY
ncbi:MAG: hypothetical protein H6529_08930 [Nocardioides sp.]|nr:hypothetical protein [Nocardioides sp.]